jgi:hypothetical protein
MRGRCRAARGPPRSTRRGDGAAGDRKRMQAMNRLTVCCQSALLVTSAAPNAFGWGAVRGPYGGAAYRGPMGARRFAVPMVAPPPGDLMAGPPIVLRRHPWLYGRWCRSRCGGRRGGRRRRHLCGLRSGEHQLLSAALLPATCVVAATLRTVGMPVWNADRLGVCPRSCVCTITRGLWGLVKLLREQAS